MSRPPSGPEQVSKLDGSEEAKRRARLILETVTGQRSVESVCQELGIGETRFEDLRRECLQAAVSALEPKPIGRPPKPLIEMDPRFAAIEAENERLKVELVTAHIREELAIGLPNATRLKKKRKR